MTPARLRAHLGPALSLGLLAVAVTAPPARSQSCPVDPSRTPASGAPPALWGELKPADTGTLPPERDSTDFNEFEQDFSAARLFMDLDVEGGWMFTAYTHGLQLWDARGAKAASPQLVSTVASNRFPVFSTDPHEFEPTRRIDAPSDASAVVVGTTGGINIFDTSSKTGFSPKYGDSGQSTLDVFAGRVNGRNYAVAANYAGVTVYDMSAAVARSSTCVDTTPDSASCGVYLGRLSSQYGATYVHGVGDPAGTRLWVVIGGLDVGVELWDLTNPLAPLQLAKDPLGNKAIAGAVLFRSGGGYYLAVRTSDAPQSQARIYNVSCIASGSCNGVGAPIWSTTLAADGGVGNLMASQSNGRPFLYYSTFLRCPDGLQQEWLYDVSNPGAPVDITPAPATVNGALTGYWGYYYRANPTGFNHVRPRAGQFEGDYFYRAAYGILDVHTLTTPSAAVSSFTWSPDPPYAGQTVSFTDTSTGQPTQWSWSFSADASPVASSQRNPQVVFSTPGAKSVSLTASNGVPPNDTETRTVQVLDPAPTLSGLGVSPPSPVQCQPVTLEALGASGLPPLGYTWQVLDASQAPALGFTSQNSPSVVWDTAGAPDGAYTASLAVSGSGPSATAQTTINLGALSALPGNGSFTPTNDAYTQGTVQFHVDVPGATEFCWSFGDGSHFPTGCATGAAWSDDPLVGPNPIHTYTVIGTYQVTVQVRNCVDTTPRTSAPLSLPITSVQPLVAEFEAQGICDDSGFGGFEQPCLAAVGVAVTFLDKTLGSPQQYEYDWEGDGVFDQTSSTPITSHTYTTTTPSGAPHEPTLRVTRGPEVDVFVHKDVQVGTPQPKSIGISGPSSGAPNQQLSFSASASGCSATPGAWTWTASGGAITGNGSSSVQISWSTTGSKTVTAKNSACGTTQGTKSVSISTTPPPPPPPPPGGGTFAASFTFSPASPEVSQTVSFTSTSSGSPTDMQWDFGDGASANGKQVTHAYAAAGSYSVKLTISKADSSCEPWGYCSDTETRTVTVAGDPVLTAMMSTDAFCSTGICFIETGQQVTLHDVSTGEVTSREWDLGDGTVSTDEIVTHVWRRPGSYTVTLTVGDGEDTSEASLSFSVEGDALGGAETTLGAAPAATLLFPYFAVDLETPRGETTLLGVTNTAPDARLVQVTLWTNWGIPTLSFPVYLSGHDVYPLNLRDVFAGQIPVTGPVSSNRALEDFPEKAFPACGGEESDVPQPTVDAAHLRAWHMGQPSPANGLCASAPGVPGVAEGYVTVDVVEECSFSSPADAGYFAADGSGIASNENVLLGDFFIVDSSDDSAQAELAVHIRAGEEFFGDGDYTFYGRYVGGDGSDKRQPLASVFESHYLSGGAFTGGTRLLVWRDTKSPTTEPLQCGDAPAWGPLPEGQVVVFDEAGMVTFDGSGERFPWATQRVDVGESIPIAAPAGRVQIDLNHGRSELFGDAAQAYVLSTFSALGRFSVDLQAKALAGTSTEVAAATSSARASSGLAPKRIAAETFDATAFSRACDVGTVPAATLLFPYFEVDLASGGLDTLISFENTAPEPRLTQVTLWTDWGVPSLSFNVYLSGYDTQSLSMRDVLNGRLPHTGPVSSSRDLESVPEVGFPGCGGTFVDVPMPFVDAAQLKAFHRGEPAPPTGQCFGGEHFGGHAVGFVTVDVVNRCSLLRPSDVGYFEDGGDGVASNDNVLVGDFFLVNSAQNSAQGNAAVHLVADSVSFGGGDYTFYGRFVNGSGADNRQPLGSVYTTRYLQGGAFDGGTWLIVWRDSKSAEVGPVTCGGEPSWSPLDKPHIDVMNEDGLVTYSGRRGGYNAMTQLVGAGGAKLPIKDPFGHLVLDLNHEGSGLFGGSAQGWVGVLYSAEGRFSTGGSAHVLGRVCGSP